MYEPFLGVNPWTALFVLLNTLIIFFVAKKYFFAPLEALIASRQKEIKDSYNAAGNARREAEQLRAENQHRLDCARQTGEKLVKDALRRSREQEEAILRSARAEAAAIAEKAKRDIEEEKANALDSAREEIAQLSISIAGLLLSRELTIAGQRELIDGFLAELEDGP